MTMFEIPLPTRAQEGVPFSFRVSLFGVLYGFSFKPNLSGDYWSFDLLGPDGLPIASGVKAVENYSLLSRCSNQDKPPGYLWLIDTSSSRTHPTIADLGARLRLVYDDGL